MKIHIFHISRDIFRSAISVEQQRIDDVNRYDMDCLIFENEQNDLQENQSEKKDSSKE